MERQLAIIKLYKEKFPEMKTFKQISQHTGIQLTRVFRLFNLSAMKLQEFQIFERLIKAVDGKDESIFSIVDDCVSELSLEASEELKRTMQRRLHLKKLKEKGNHSF